MISLINNDRMMSSAMRARIGEKSIIPMGGSIFRAVFRIGSVISWMNR